jgi:hypothetical protein
MKIKTQRVKLDWSKLLAFGQIASILNNCDDRRPVNPAKAMVGGKGAVGTVSYLPFYIVTESSKRGLGWKFATV